MSMLDADEPLDVLPISLSGLSRCCLATWQTLAPPASRSPEGTLLVCVHCRQRMIVRDGAWRWDNTL